MLGKVHTFYGRISLVSLIDNERHNVVVVKSDVFSEKVKSYSSIFYKYAGCCPLCESKISNKYVLQAIGSNKV